MLCHKPGGVRVPTVAARGGASAGSARPGCSITAGHRGGVACLETRSLRLTESPGHRGGACGEGWDAAPVDLSGYCGIEGCFKCTVDTDLSQLFIYLCKSLILNFCLKLTRIESPSHQCIPAWRANHSGAKIIFSNFQQRAVYISHSDSFVCVCVCVCCATFLKCYLFRCVNSKSRKWRLPREHMSDHHGTSHREGEGERRQPCFHPLIKGILPKRLKCQKK